MKEPWGQVASDRNDGHRSVIGLGFSLRGRYGNSLVAWVVLLSISTEFSIAAPRDSLAGPLPVEYETKAAFVFNFGALVEWPGRASENSSDPIVFCVAAPEEVVAIFETSYHDRRIGDRPTAVRPVSSPEKMLGCHIAFITERLETSHQPLLDAAAGSPILTVGEVDGFARNGGIVSFYAQGTQIRFEINTAVAESAGLRISSRLLRLARIVSSESE